MPRTNAEIKKSNIKVNSAVETLYFIKHNVNPYSAGIDFSRQNMTS